MSSRNELDGETDPELTVVVVPRDTYRHAVDVLDHLVGLQGSLWSLVWVDDDRCPARTRQRIHRRLEDAGGQYISMAGRRGANECRARGLAASNTRYVMLMDNDVYLSPEALPILLDSIRESPSAFVAPMVMNPDGSVHHAGGETRIEVDQEGNRRLYEQIMTGHRVPSLVRGGTPMSSTALEMHAVLLDARLLDAAGGLDERLISSMDCADLSLRLGSAPGGGWLEPKATVLYPRPRVGLRNLTLYWARWSRATVEHDLVCFAETWRLELDDPGLDKHRDFLRQRRMRPLRYARGRLRRLFGDKAAGIFDAVVDRFLDCFSDVRRH